MSQAELLCFVLLLLLLLSATAPAAAGVPESDRQSEFFRLLSLPDSLNSCRPMLQMQPTYPGECLQRWLQLRQQGADPAFIHFSPLMEAGRCEISVWCDQLLLNQSDPRAALLPASRGQPKLVLFAVRSGSRVKVLDSFLTPANCNRSLLVSPMVGPPPLDFWRSCWLDRLPDLVRLLSAKTLSVEIVKDGATALKISFDAGLSGLSLTSWFSKERLVGSEPELGLASRSYNFFSVVGHPLPNVCNRTFYISTHHGGCRGDMGVLAVMEQQDVCSWSIAGIGSMELPRIVFNRDAGLWENHAAVADFLLVTAG